MQHEESGWPDSNICEYTEDGRERKREVRDIKYFEMREVREELMSSCGVRR